ncbi:hypothetical protein D3C71_2113780 [compost metagenome]
MLRHAGAAVAAVIVGVHREPVRRERVHERAVAPGMLADAVEQLDHTPRCCLRRMDVVDDRDAVRVGVLGHAASLGLRFL